MIRRIGCIAGALSLVFGLIAGGRTAAAGSHSPDSASSTSNGGPSVLLTEPARLRALESAGASLAERLGGARAGDNRALAAQPIYASVIAVLESDLGAIRAADPAADTGLRKAHRLFDAGWLRSQRTRFELVGLALRLDRRPFAPRDGCGEIRLIYRLGYQGSRLPMTVNLVFWARDERGGLDCRSLARQLGQPFDAAMVGKLLARDRLKSFEVNLQSVRWPSTVRPDMAGHAEYLLRVFRPDAAGTRLDATPLENTPDVERIARDPALRAELVRWMRDPANLPAIDAGTALLPERYLATRAVSYAPLGLARLANRPFRRLVAPADLAGLDLSGRRTIGSPAAMLRRLDGMSCAGCHQSRSVAGFHLIGQDDPSAAGSNHIAVAASPHLTGDLLRRRRVLAALASGDTPDDRRAPAERADEDPGGYGAHCGLGDPGFERWTCAAGLRCVHAEDDELGQCLPAAPGPGDPCQLGRLHASADPHRDRVAAGGPDDAACGSAAAFCQSTRAGFPGGMCAVPCQPLPRGAACGGVPALREFNDCLAKHVPFETCVARTAHPNGLRACDDANPCRDDYICARVAPGQGACMPPYFLFQMRVDGHLMN